MDKYYEIRKIIEEAGDIVEFAEYGNGISDEWIEKAEVRLGFNLPETYKWWLRNYSGGEIRGEEIFSIYEQDFDTVVGGDIVYMHELNKKQHNCENNMLVICETDDSVFYFDISVNASENEYPIMSLNENTLYAHDFIEFLKKRIINE
jgi:hypothetical protein